MLRTQEKNVPSHGAREIIRAFYAAPLSVQEFVMPYLKRIATGEVKPHSILNEMPRDWENR